MGRTQPQQDPQKKKGDFWGSSGWKIRSSPIIQPTGEKRTLRILLSSGRERVGNPGTAGETNTNFQANIPSSGSPAMHQFPREFQLRVLRSGCKILFNSPAFGLVRRKPEILPASFHGIPESFRLENPSEPTEPNHPQPCQHRPTSPRVTSTA